MVDDNKPKSNRNIGLIGTALTHQGLRQMAAAIGAQSVLKGTKAIVVTVDSESEGLMKALREGAKQYDAVIIATDAFSEPMRLELKNCYADANNLEQTAPLIRHNRDNWLHGSERPWKRKRRR